MISTHRRLLPAWRDRSSTDCRPEEITERCQTVRRSIPGCRRAPPFFAVRGGPISSSESFSRPAPGFSNRPEYAHLPSRMLYSQRSRRSLSSGLPADRSRASRRVKSSTNDGGSGQRRCIEQAIDREFRRWAPWRRRMRPMPAQIAPGIARVGHWMSLLVLSVSSRSLLQSRQPIADLAQLGEAARAQSRSIARMSWRDSSRSYDGAYNGRRPRLRRRAAPSFALAGIPGQSAASACLASSVWSYAYIRRAHFRRPGDQRRAIVDCRDTPSSAGVSAKKSPRNSADRSAS